VRSRSEVIRQAASPNQVQADADRRGIEPRSSQAPKISGERSNRPANFSFRFNALGKHCLRNLSAFG
jgi:hypothetical protein